MQSRSEAMVDEISVVGPRLNLRRLVEGDAYGPYLNWINDRVVNRYLESRFVTYSSADLVRFIEEVNKPGNEAILLAVCHTKSNIHIGNVKLAIRQSHKVGEMSLVIGDRAMWGKGIGSETIALMTEYGFSRLGLRKIAAGCYAENVAAIGAFQNCGYREEGRLREHFVIEGRVTDGVRLGLLTTDPSLWRRYLDTSRNIF
jgi:ribosomal-protein-alanine N-acetyltransferase